jgi:deoxyadenosine/deoxycytidine kinase
VDPSREPKSSGQRYIALEGPIGVGKTALANLLARRLSATPVLELAEENPFLRRFYADMGRYAFQTQIFFLLSRYRQLSALAQGDLFQERVVCDYIFAKDKIFAYMTLDDQELLLYEQIFGLLQTRLPKPDVVVYLQASVEVLLERIRTRGHDYEKNITRKYLEDLNEAYDYYFFHYRETPLLVVKTSSIDFVRNEADLDDLVGRILSTRRGVEYYTPLGSR